MRNLIVNLKRIVTAVAFMVLLCGPALAGTVEDMLEALRDAAPQDAWRIERDVTREWSKSGSAAMDLLLKRGRDAFEIGDFNVAIEHFTALTDHAPDFAEGWFARARAYHAVGLYGPALDDLGKTLTLNPNQFDAIYGLGAMFHEFTDFARAEQAYRLVLSLHPNHKDAQAALDLLKRAGIGREL